MTCLCMRMRVEYIMEYQNNTIISENTLENNSSSINQSKSCNMPCRALQEIMSSF